jgi:hypothetical protein
MLEVLDKEMRCSWLATFTGPSPDFRKRYLFRAVLRDSFVFYLEVRVSDRLVRVYHSPEEVEVLVEELRRGGYSEEWNRECFIEPVEKWVEFLKERLFYLYDEEDWREEIWAIQVLNFLEFHKDYLKKPWPYMINLYFEGRDLWDKLLPWEKERLTNLILKHIEKEKEKQIQNQKEVVR